MLLLALWSVNVQAEQKILDTSFFIDPTHGMSLQEVTRQARHPMPSLKFSLAPRSTIWVRFELPPMTVSPNRSEASSTGSTDAYIRLVTMYLSRAQLFDPLRADDRDGVALTLPVESGLIHRALNVPIAPSSVSRAVWLRLEVNGPLVMSSLLLERKALELLEVQTVLFHGFFIGLLGALFVLALSAWLYDRSMLAGSFALKQASNLAVAAINLHWPERLLDATQSTSHVLEGSLTLLRFVNPILSFWFFMCFASLFTMPRWALRLQQVFLGLLFLNVILLLVGQTNAARALHLACFFLGFPVVVLIGALCAGGMGLKGAWNIRAITLLRVAGFMLLFMMAWFSSYPIGFYRVVTLGPAVGSGGAIISSVALLFIIILNRKQTAMAQRTRLLYEENLAKAALQFERNERVRQQEFMVMLTHELKAPLSAVGMVLHSAQVSTTMRQHADMALAAMRRVIDHCAKAIRLDDAALAIKPQQCSLPVQLQLRIDSLTPAERARIRLEAEPDLADMQTDLEALSVVLSNLLDNALKYSPPQSPILVSVRSHQGVSGATQILCVANESLPGPLPRAELMFGKYYRGEGGARVSGSGLGLYLSRALARRMGGDLTFEGQDRTVRLTLTLPLFS